MSSASSHLMSVSTEGKKSERFCKFTILTPRTFLPPDHSESLKDNLAEEFAGYLCERVHEQLGSRSYTPKRSGEAFLNMRFDEFEERFLRHSEYVIFITSGKNAASLDIIYPRMLVFLTIRPTWRSQGIVIYLGPPEGQKVFDPNLFLTKPLIFPMSPDDWNSAENPWEALLGRLQTQVPITPEPMRSKQQSAKDSTNKNAVLSPPRPLHQSAAHTVGPIRNKKAKHNKLLSSNFIQLSEQGKSTHLFVPPPPSSSTTQRSSFRQLDSRYSILRSLSTDDMCFRIRYSKKKSATSSKKLIEKQKQNSDSELAKKSKADLLCIFSRLRSPKSKRKGDRKQENMVVQAPEVIRAVAPEIEITETEGKPLHEQCLQVQTEDEILDRIMLPYATLPTSPKKWKKILSGNGRRARTRLDSGIVSNYSLGSTENSTSIPSLYLHHNLQQSSTASPQSVLSTSTPSYLDGHYSRNRKSSHGTSSIHTDSGTEDQRVSYLEESLKFADEENLADTTIPSNKSGMCATGPFIKPGIKPLKNSKHSEEEIPSEKIELRLHQQLINQNSKASSYSSEDLTISEKNPSKLSEDFDIQAEAESHEYTIHPQMIQFEQISAYADTSSISESFQKNAVNEISINDADIFIKKTVDSLQQCPPVNVQNPMSSVDSVGSCDHQSIFSSAETVIYRGHALSMETQNASPVVEASSNLSIKVVKEDMNENQHVEAVNEDLSLERNYNLYSKMNSEITEKVTKPENSIEISANMIAEAIVNKLTEEVLLNGSIAQLNRKHSSESEEIIMKENKLSEKSSFNLKLEPTEDDQSNVEVENDGYQISTIESPPRLSRNASRSFKASRDSGLHSIGGSDTASIEHSSIYKEGIIPHSEEIDSLTNLPQKLLAVMGEAPKTNGKYSMNQVQEEVIVAAVTIGDHSIPYEEPHQEMYALNSQIETSIMDKSIDSGIHSAVSTLRKSTASASLSVTDDTEQYFDISARIPEVETQETVNPTLYAHQEAQIVDEVLPPITPVQEVPLSTSIQELNEEIAPVNKSQNQSEMKTEVDDIQPIVTPTQELSVSERIPEVKEDIVDVSQAQNGPEIGTELEKTADILPVTTPVQEILVSALVEGVNGKIGYLNQALEENERKTNDIDIQPIISPAQEAPIFAAFSGKYEEHPLERMDLSERNQDSVYQNGTAQIEESTYPLSNLDAGSELINTSPETLIIVCSKTPLNSPPSEDSIKGQPIEKEQEIVKEISPSAESEKLDSEELYDKKAYEIVRDMLESCSLVTQKLVQNAVLTYDLPSKYDKSKTLNNENPKQVIGSATDANQSNLEIVQRPPNFLRKVIPQVSVALINLSTAYIPRYISTIYDYSVALIRRDHPDRNLQQLTTSVHEAFLNHPLGMPALLAGTTLISPWVIRQFPLTVLAACQEAPDVLRRLFLQPGNFLAEHFADVSGVFQVTPTWSLFAIVGSRGTHWRRLQPTT